MAAQENPKVLSRIIPFIKGEPACIEKSILPQKPENRGTIASALAMMMLEESVREGGNTIEIPSLGITIGKEHLRDATQSAQQPDTQPVKGLGKFLRVEYDSQ